MSARELSAFGYLTAPRAALYRQVMLTFVSAKRRFTVHLRPEDVQDSMGGNTDLVVVLTTNHPEELHKGMMRPGRLDSIVEIGALDGHGIERLIRSVIDEKRLAKDIDFAPIVDACEDYMPAFVKEAADRAVRYALARSEGNIGNYVISTEDLVFAAGGLRSQFNRMQDAPEHSNSETLAGSLQTLMEAGAKKATLALAAGRGQGRRVESIGV